MEKILDIGTRVKGTTGEGEDITGTVEYWDDNQGIYAIKTDSGDTRFMEDGTIKSIGKAKRINLPEEFGIYNEYDLTIDSPEHKRWEDDEGNIVAIDNELMEDGKYWVMKGSEQEGLGNIVSYDNEFDVVERAKTEMNPEYIPQYSTPKKKSKRKKPITFKRSSVPHVPKSSGPKGPGRGWHKQSVRHSKASIKGWKGRRR